MQMTVACPRCASQLSVPPELAGQVLSCPQCHVQFQMNAPGAGDGDAHQAAPPAATGPTPSGPRWRGNPSVLSTGLRLNEPAPALAPAQTPPQTAVPRFRPADPSTALVPLTQDGTLPELRLAEAKQHARQAATEKPARPMTLTLVLAASLSLSVCLSLIDFSPQTSEADARRQARSTISQYYREGDASLAPYQLLLRDAQRAHSRGDHATERARYRQVLRMLRAENRPTSLTETHEGDQELQEAIAQVLREE